MVVTIKKYANRRLYDTGESRYITIEELAIKVRGGADVRVIDAATADDLTQVTLTQIILESRGAARMLPVPLLTQLIRMGDDTLTEFLGKYLSTALELYLQARHSAQSLAPMNPFATLPFQMTSGLARLFSGGPLWGNTTPPPPPANAGPPHPAPPPPAAAPAPAPAGAAEVADLRRELEELKSSMRPRRKPRK